MAGSPQPSAAPKGSKILISLLSFFCNLELTDRWQLVLHSGFEVRSHFFGSFFSTNEKFGMQRL